MIKAKPFAYAVTASRSPWFYGPYGFVLRAVRPITPLPYRGQLGLFRVDRWTSAAASAAALASRSRASPVPNRTNFPRAPLR